MAKYMVKFCICLFYCAMVTWGQGGDSSSKKM